MASASPPTVPKPKSKVGVLLAVYQDKVQSYKKKLQEKEAECENAEKEFRRVTQKAEESETEVGRLQKELGNLEDELDTSETKLAKITARLHEAEKQADESERARRVLEDRGQTDDDRLAKLQAEYEDVVSKNADVEDRYSQISSEIEDLERHLEDEEQKAVQAEELSHVLLNTKITQKNWNPPSMIYKINWRRKGTYTIKSKVISTISWLRSKT
ncbi:tropomyosin-1-like isoform X5 [Clytia hemisphaerica]|uniref:tropomyosin-1-like isoform X5 n=1 Tax=Clytia hemisphaerica TaxID=252671 RepID=UPI0034D3A6B1